jgi:hypothetical protein
MENFKKLYFLHVPKNAGQTVIKTVSTALRFKEIKHYTNSIPPHYGILNDNVFLAGHFGTYPIEKLNGFSVACVFRDPLKRVLSNFNYIYPILTEREEYYKINSFADRLRYYLFHDKNFELHKNVQARFICNPAQDKVFEMNQYVEHNDRDTAAKHLMQEHWFVKNDKTSLEFAKKQIDSFNIVGTLEKYEDFCNQLYGWFDKNYNVSIKYNKNIILNNSFNIDGGNSYTSLDLGDMLNKKEYDRIIEDNALDYEIYNYARDITK